jgi:hypothetical protein
MTRLSVPFNLRQRAGSVLADVSANDDPGGWGCTLLDTSLPAEAALGYPVCVASVEYPLRGYAAAMGWVQFVRSSDSDPEAYEIDPTTIYRDVNTPFAWFGAPPTLFDAPFRERRYEMTWRARSYLCASPDGVMTRQAHAIAAFAWGFDVLEDLSIAVVGPEPLGIETWEDHVDQLRQLYPGWVFGHDL